jgi:hypothetical protein
MRRTVDLVPQLGATVMKVRQLRVTTVPMEADTTLFAYMARLNTTIRTITGWTSLAQVRCYFELNILSRNQTSGKCGTCKTKTFHVACARPLDPYQ